MAFLIRRKEPIDTEVRRVLLEQVRRSATLLKQWRDNPRDNVHQARQSFKRVRALLRLIRPGARYVYQIENRIFRGLGRQLAYARDTEAVVEALSLLDDQVSGPLARESLGMLRVGLQRRASRERECGIHDLDGRIAEAGDVLAAADKRARDMPLEGLRRKDLRRGVEATIEQCVAAYARAAANRKPDDLHAWRRHVKFAYHQTRLMQQLMPSWAGDAGPELETLASTLGHYHDLIVLGQLLKTQADDLNIDVHLRSIRNAVRDSEHRLAAEAIARGARLFAPDSTKSGNIVRFRSRA